MPRIDPFAPSQRSRRPAREIAYDFVLEQLSPLEPSTRPMFGAHGVYLEQRVICILRQKGDRDDGVWLCFEPECEAEVMALLPNLARIEVLGNVRNWRKLAANSPSFEDDVLRACKLLLSGDTRIGKLPDRLKAKHKALARERASAGTQPRSRAKSRTKSKASSPSKPEKPAPARRAKAALHGAPRATSRAQSEGRKKGQRR